MVTGLTRNLLSKNNLLIIILVTGAWMRLQNLTQPFVDVFSWRQGSTAMMAENFFKTDWNIFYPQVNWTGASASYQGREFQTVSYLAAIAYRVFGQHDVIGRIIPIIFGLWGIFALYQLVLLVWDKKHALAGAAMMAIIPGSAFIDRSFLPDPAMVSLTTTGMWLFVLYLRTNKTKHLVWAGTIGCLGILSKLPGLIIAIPMTYALISVNNKRGTLDFKHLRPVLLAAVLVLFPIITYYLWARHLSLSYPPYHFAGSGNWIWDNWGEMFRKHFLLVNLKNVFEYWILGFPAIMLFIMGLILSPPDNDNHSGMKGFFHYLLFGCMFYYFIGAAELIKNPWNFHLFLPVISVFCGRVLVVVYSFSHSRQYVKFSRVAILVVFMIGYNVILMRKQLFIDNKALNSYKLGKELKTIKSQGDLVITIAQDMGDPIAIYYSGANGWVFPPADQWAPKELPKDDSLSVKSLKELQKEGADWFGIVDKHYKDIQVNHPALAGYITSQMSIVKKTDNFVILKWQQAAL
jgi:hypothetical protein